MQARVRRGERRGEERGKERRGGETPLSGGRERRGEGRGGEETKTLPLLLVVVETWAYLGLHSQFFTFHRQNKRRNV